MHFPSVIHIILEKQGENKYDLHHTDEETEAQNGQGSCWWYRYPVVGSGLGARIRAFYLPPDSSCGCSLASISPPLPPPHLITFPPPPLLSAPSVASQVIEAICSH